MRCWAFGSFACLGLGLHASRNQHARTDCPLESYVRAQQAHSDLSARPSVWDEGDWRRHHWSRPAAHSRHRHSTLRDGRVL
eukprot:2842694-Pleurochrysis_carterae.AAC.1